MTDPKSAPPPGRIAGVDYGTVRIGVAVTNASRTLASALTGYQRGSPEADARFFRTLVADEGIRQFVVGLPVHLAGHESQKSTEARQFGRWLGQVTGVPVVYYDGRFTTSE